MRLRPQLKKQIFRCASGRFTTAKRTCFTLREKGGEERVAEERDENSNTAAGCRREG